MAKSTKKKSPKSSPKGGGSSRVAYVPHDFHAAEKNNPTFRFCIIFKGFPQLTVAFPYQTVPAKVFQCGRDTDSIHHVAKEAIRAVISNGIATLVPPDGNVSQIIDGYIEQYYSKNTTSNGFFQFAFSGSADKSLRYTFQAVSNSLAVAPVLKPGEMHTIMCFAPESIIGMVQELVQSRIFDKPEDKFFDDARSFLPSTLTAAYDAYIATPTKARKFERFSEAIYRDSYGTWYSPYCVYTVQAVDPDGPADSNRDPPRSSEGPTGSDGNPSGTSTDGPNQISSDEVPSGDPPSELPDSTRESEPSPDSDSPDVPQDSPESPVDESVPPQFEDADIDAPTAATRDPSDTAPDVPRVEVSQEESKDDPYPSLDESRSRTVPPPIPYGPKPKPTVQTVPSSEESEKSAQDSKPSGCFSETCSYCQFSVSSV